MPDLKKLDNFFKFLTCEGLVEDIYNAMRCSKALDMSRVVEIAIDILEAREWMPQVTKEVKSQSKSAMHRTMGNQAYTEGAYNEALECYNQALLYAPKNSQEMVLAYSNRSALMLKINAIPACLKDIAVCFKIGCSTELSKKLTKRREDCKQRMWLHNLKTQFMRTAFSTDFFNFKLKHPQIGCISSEVDIIKDSSKLKVVAAKDIKVGSVIGLETAFVTQTRDDNLKIACFYCQNMSFNLIPCDGCCFALFCSEKCKKQCLNEYHDTECQIYEFIDTLLEDPYLRIKLMIKATLKLKNKCDNWEEFIEKTNWSTDSITARSIHEIFDKNHEFSILNFDDNPELIYGSMFNASFICAAIIINLSQIPFFFPIEEARKAAISSLAKVMMHLLVYSPRHVQIYNSAEDAIQGNITTSPDCNYGWLSFVGKLKHACDANLMVLGANNQAALIAAENIKKGTQLSISYLGYWYEAVFENNPLVLFKYIKATCSCRICQEKWCHKKYKFYELNDTERAAYRKWTIAKSKVDIMGTDEKFFRLTCKTLQTLNNAMHTQKHYDVWWIFRTCISFYQAIVTGNIIIEAHYPDRTYIVA